MWKNWTPARRRYEVRVMTSMAVYVVALLSDVWLFKHHPPQSLAKYFLAILPALPLVAVVLHLGVYLAEETDEYQRSLMVEAILWGTGGTLVIASVWGFLENLAGVTHVEAYWGVVIWLFLFGLARCFRPWRRR